MRKLKIISDWKKQLKSYSFLSLLGSALTAISISALAVLGVLSSELAFSTLACLAIFFGILGCAGRFIDQTDGEGDNHVE